MTAMWPESYLATDYFSIAYFQIATREEEPVAFPRFMGGGSIWRNSVAIDAVASGAVLKARASIRAGRARGDAVAQAYAFECSAALMPGKAGVHIAAASQLVELRSIIIDGAANGVDTVQDENNFLFCMAA